MKVNELMIGDLITFKDCQYDDEIVVVKIYQINQESNALVFIDDDKALDEVTIDEEFVGIPLTPDILEKNGFEYMNDEYGCWMMGKLELIEKEPYNSLFEVEINISGETVFLHYLHELQHALRLCGIEKEIIL